MATLQEMRSESRPYQTDVRWFHSETVTDATSEPLILPSLGREAAVAVTPGTDALVLVQYSLSSYADLEADAGVWHDWDEGTVTAAASSLIDGSVSALRLTSTGASSWEVTV